jgi:flagellar biosynthesis/type III secretory pathway protein FliH
LQVAADGFREGYEKGQKDGTEEGYTLGLKHGTDLGLELGLYRGTATTWLLVDARADIKIGEKALSAWHQVVTALDNLPAEVRTDADMSKVRAAYKKACALVKMGSAQPSDSTLQF